MTAHRTGKIMEQNTNTSIARPNGWNADELRLVRDLWLAGATLSAIAARLGRTPEAVRSRVRRLCLAPRRSRRGAVAAAAGQARTCLCCAGRFLSQGPHNRLCDPCRARGDADYRVAL